MNSIFLYTERFLLFLIVCTSATRASCQPFVWCDGHRPATVFFSSPTDPVVDEAMSMFSCDMKAVTGIAAVRSRQPQEAVIRLVQLDKIRRGKTKSLQRMGIPVDSLQKMIDGFHISVACNHILVVGSNGRGTAYGLLELSRLAGVNPWTWWGDIPPERRLQLAIDHRYTTLQGASVAWRGIFLNDEDWSFRPWSAAAFGTSQGSTISLQSYRHLFRLLMRLRANACWPAMHPGSTAFFKIPGAKALADSCGIAIGSSHCEPLLRNNVGEWDTRRQGPFNYITNRAAVHDYWEQRLKEVKQSAGGNLLTIGMRGIHDGSMEGVGTMKEKFQALQQVIDDQQHLIAKYLGDPAQQTQVFIPYKEVLDIYNMGLNVPDHVTLMWCDDNYGYLTRLSDSLEQQRPGGAGVYYHLSYWGQPHDYLWLTTTQPGLIYSEMKTAYDYHARKLWIANIHDPKVAGYGLELFLDMAWDIRCVSAGTVGEHYHRWLCRQFGQEVGNKLWPVMCQFYQLCSERKPEFMGWNQVERWDLYSNGQEPVHATAFSPNAFGNELDRYLDRYASVAASVESIQQTVCLSLGDAFFAAIAYPVLAAEAQARKMLWAQKACLAANDDRFASADSVAWRTKLFHACAESQQAYNDIQTLTHRYNEQNSRGKWHSLMDMRPRKLPVFDAPQLPIRISNTQIGQWLDADTAIASHPVDTTGAVARNASQWQYASAGARTVSMLGHSMSAVWLPQGDSLVYIFSTPQDWDAVLRVALVPTHPNDKGDLRFSASIDGASPVVFSLKEPFRSEQWKQNVLRGQALRTLTLGNLWAGTHTLIIKALDNHVIVDQWMVDSQPSRPFYLFPTH